MLEATQQSQPARRSVTLKTCYLAKLCDILFYAHGLSYERVPGEFCEHEKTWHD